MKIVQIKWKSKGNSDKKCKKEDVCGQEEPYG